MEGGSNLVDRIIESILFLPSLSSGVISSKRKEKKEKAFLVALEGSQHPGLASIDPLYHIDMMFWGLESREWLLL